MVRYAGKRVAWLAQRHHTPDVRPARLLSQESDLRRAPGHSRDRRAEPNSIIFKIESMRPDLLQRVNQDPRVGIGTKMRAKGWLSFDLNSEEDLRDALGWLNEAYERAK
jgi:hypothetical protein